MRKTPAKVQRFRRRMRHARRTSLWRRWYVCRMRQHHARRVLFIVILPLALMGAASGLFVAMEDPGAGTILYTTCFLMLPWLYANRRYDVACKATRRARHNYCLLEGQCHKP